MKLKILGCVSPYPNKKNACPGYLITDNNIRILLDCGNGITKNLKLPYDLENLTIIISHLHKDHYGDLLALGYASYVYNKLGILKDKINVYIPKDENLEDYNYLINFKKENYLNIIPYKEDTTININSLNISFKETKHPIKTYAIKITDNKNTLTYSSDTGFDNNLINFFKNSDILLCESSFLKEQKNGNNHLTAEEAGKLAKLSNVKKLILTHYWPEIKNKKYLKEAKSIFKNTKIADNKKVYKLKKK